MKIGIFKYIVWIILPFFIIGCSVGKYIPEGEYYLKDIKVACEDEKVDEAYPLIDYVQQYPNSKWFGLKIPLGIYKLSGKDSTNWFSTFFRKIGEAPVVYDSVMAVNSVVDIKRMLSNEGYVSKAPKQIVDNEKSTLEKEEYELKLILDKLNV